MHRLAALILAVVPLGALAAPPPDQWFTVLLDGRKIGSFEMQREVAGGRVRTAQTLDLSIERAGTAIAMTSRESSEETADGKPLAFGSSSKLSGSETTVDGIVHDGTIAITTTTGGARAARTMPWPDGALLPEGLRLQGLHAGLAPGTTYRSLAFQPSSLDVSNVETRVGAKQAVDVPGGRRPLVAIDQTLTVGGVPVASKLWVDDDQNVHKLTMPIIGVDLVLLACDKACATAPNQGTDIFDRTLIEAPRALAHAEFARGMRYELAASDAGTLKFPDTGEQRVVANGPTATIEVLPAARADAEAAPADADYAPNDWLQSTSPEVIALALKAAGDAKESGAQMKNLETFVRGYIANKSLGVGYASALEVVRKPEGDCTEHAVLLAALGRSLGIATRVVDGLAYAPGFAGKQRVFVPHAWVQAWVAGRWQSFDAALPGFDAGHIALSIGDGDPWRFYSGLDMLGRIAMRDATPLDGERVR